MKRAFPIILSFLIICWATLTAYNLGLFSEFNYFQGQHDVARGKVQLVMVGELPRHVQTVDSLTQAHGFWFYYSDPEITKDALKGAKYYNDAVMAHLKSVHDYGWWNEFSGQYKKITGTDPSHVGAMK